MIATNNVINLTIKSIYQGASASNYLLSLKIGSFGSGIMSGE